MSKEKQNRYVTLKKKTCALIPRYIIKIRINKFFESDFVMIKTNAIKERSFN